MRTSNPAFSRQEAFAPREWGGIMADLQRSETKARVSSTTMTVGGTIAKTSILLVIAVAVATFAWKTASENPSLALPMGLGGGLAGCVFAFIIGFKPQSAPFLSPVYAALQGLFLGLTPSARTRSSTELTRMALA